MNESPKPRVLLSRRISFTSGRRLFHPDWSDARNSEVYGRGALPHGHEYLLDVAFDGPISRSDGMIVNISELKPILSRVVLPFDNAWLPGDIPEFASKRPTAENIALAVWNALPPSVGTSRLARLQLQESRRARVEIERRSHALDPLTCHDNTLMKTSRSYEFAAAHRLFAPTLSDAENQARFDKCSNPAGHGHNYGLEVTLVGEPDAQSGYLIAPARLDALVEEEVFARFDHKHLNIDCPEFTLTGLIPTSENLARVIFDLLQLRLEREGFRLARIGLHETQKNYFEVEARSV